MRRIRHNDLGTMMILSGNVVCTNHRDSRKFPLRAGQRRQNHQRPRDGLHPIPTDQLLQAVARPWRARRRGIAEAQARRGIATGELFPFKADQNVGRAFQAVLGLPTMGFLAAVPRPVPGFVSGAARRTAVSGRDVGRSSNGRSPSGRPRTIRPTKSGSYAASPNSGAPASEASDDPG